MEAYEVIKLLQSKRNVLVMGAPGTGKSRLLNEIAWIFEKGLSVTKNPSHQPGAAITIPATPALNTIGNLAILKAKNRKVFRTTLHQNSKYRDFLTGITPRLDGHDGYEISQGILYRANEFAMQKDSASLVIIDEINRGPAIEVFGGSIVAIEADKRLSNDNTPTESTQYFEILNPKDGKNTEYAFSPNLYILAAMNQADVSVAPLDVAFMRRWMSVMLYPDYQSLYKRYGVNQNHEVSNLNPTREDIYAAAFKGLENLNRKITAGRGAEYQIGQGVFLSTSPQGITKDDALNFVLECWSMIYAHIDELFFGDPNALSYLLNAEKEKSPYLLEEVTFAGETKFVLHHKPITKDNIFDLYLALQEDN